jgi:hypothetical protein
VVSGSLTGTSSVNIGGGVDPATLTAAATGTLTSAAFNVNSNGRLSGSGTLSGAVTVEDGGTLAPDAGANSLTLTTGSTLAFESGSTFALSLAHTSGPQPLDSDYSKLTLGTGISATLGGNIIANVSGTLNELDLFTIILSGTAVTGSFANATLQAGDSTFMFGSGGYTFLINYRFDADLGFDGSRSSFEGISTGTDVALLVIPEPNALSLLAGAFGLGLGLQRFRRRAPEDGLSPK